MNIDREDMLKPQFEKVGIDPSYNWSLPLRTRKAPVKKVKSVWYMALPISSAHRRSNRPYTSVLPSCCGRQRRHARLHPAAFGIVIPGFGGGGGQGRI